MWDLCFLPGIEPTSPTVSVFLTTGPPEGVLDIVYDYDFYIELVISLYIFYFVYQYFMVFYNLLMFYLFD